MMRERSVSINFAKIIWIGIAVWLAASGRVNPWLVLLLATMDIELVTRWTRRRS